MQRVGLQRILGIGCDKDDLKCRQKLSQFNRKIQPCPAAHLNVQKGDLRAERARMHGGKRLLRIGKIMHLRLRLRRMQSVCQVLQRQRLVVNRQKAIFHGLSSFRSLGMISVTVVP